LADWCRLYCIDYCRHRLRDMRAIWYFHLFIFLLQLSLFRFTSTFSQATLSHCFFDTLRYRLAVYQPLSMLLSFRFSRHWQPRLYQNTD
jgi:hypothetical protein